MPALIFCRASSSRVPPAHPPRWCSRPPSTADAKPREQLNAPRRGRRPKAAAGGGSRLSQARPMPDARPHRLGLPSPCAAPGPSYASASRSRTSDCVAGGGEVEYRHDGRHRGRSTSRLTHRMNRHEATTERGLCHSPIERPSNPRSFTAPFGAGVGSIW